MTITFEAIHLPFKVGDTVYVDEVYSPPTQSGNGENHPYFEAKVERIFFDGRLEEMSVITEPVDTFEMQVSTAVYMVKPTGSHGDLMSLPIRINLPIKEPKLFATESELKVYQHTRNQIEKDMIPNKPE